MTHKKEEKIEANSEAHKLRVEQALAMERALNTTLPKPSLWERFKDFLGLLFIAFGLLLVLACVVFLFAVLIENPVSLAILCATIILIVWRFMDR
jgi:hypothetical protein